MEPLYNFISKRINKTFFYPVIVAISLLFSIIFFLAYVQTQKNKNIIHGSVLKSFHEISTQVGHRFDENYNHFSIEVQSVKDSIVKILEDENLDKLSDNNFIYDDGFFILKDEKLYSSVYTTRLTSLSDKSKEILKTLSLVDNQIDSSIGQYDDKIDSLWINIGENYSLFYPSINIKDELQSNLNPTLYRYYYLANEENNPEKKNIFIELFNEEWALDLGQIGAIVSPIYVNNKFEGVVGIALTSANMQIFSKLDLPYDAYVIITDKTGHVLVSSNEKEFKKDFNIDSFYQMHESGVHSKLQTIDLKNLDENKYKIFTTKLKDTSLILTLIAENKKISSEMFILFEETKAKGIIIFIITFVFIIILYFYSRVRVKSLSRLISDPIDKLSEASNHLADEKKFNFEKSNILEIEHTNNNLSTAHQRLLKQLYIDPETNLGNREKLLNDLKDNNVLSLVSLDNYRMLSTIYGPHKGLLIIQDLAKSIKSMLPSTCSIYRVYNDTFAFIIADVDEDFKITQDEINEFYNTVSNHKVKIEDVEISINYSIGYCSSDPLSDFSPLARAEFALEDAKYHEYEKVVKYDSVVHSSGKFKENMNWARKLHNAFDIENFQYTLEAFFQAIYDNKNKRVKKFEMLVRMMDNDKVISPFFFLPSAAQMGKLPDITRFMFDNLLDVAQKYKDVEFSINTSFEDFEDADLLKYVKEKIALVDVNTNNIIFEILETGMFRDENVVIDTVKELKELGFKIAIDDFGAGNSNFGHLMLMEVDFIKIDGQFIKNIVNDKQSQNITNTIKEFAKLTGAKTIAEFVKDEEIFKYIESIDVDYSQGYFISEPIPVDKIDDVLKLRTLC